MCSHSKRLHLQIPNMMRKAPAIARRYALCVMMAFMSGAGNCMRRTLLTAGDPRLDEHVRDSKRAKDQVSGCTDGARVSDLLDEVVEHDCGI
jgi:hypothetical protein